MEKLANFKKKLKTPKTNSLAYHTVLIGQTLKQYRKVLKVLERNPKSGRQLLACVLLKSFKFFLPDPYYEPLSWFMITDC